MNRGGFSWKRFFGVSAAKSRISRSIGIPQPKEIGRWHIAVAHGYYFDGEPFSFLSYHITKEEIVTSGYDYVALGHINEFRCVHSGSVKAYYCGSPSASGTMAVVDLSEDS